MGGECSSPKYIRYKHFEVEDLVVTVVVLLIELPDGLVGLDDGPVFGGSKGDPLTGSLPVLLGIGDEAVGGPVLPDDDAGIGPLEVFLIFHDDDDELVGVLAFLDEAVDFFLAILDTVLEYLVSYEAVSLQHVYHVAEYYQLLFICHPVYCHPDYTYPENQVF